MTQDITSDIDSRDGVFIGGKHLHHTFKPMTNTELTLDQLQTIAGGGVFAKLDSIQGGIECKVPPSVEDVILAPLGGEDVFSGNRVEAKGSYIGGDNHF